MFLYLHSDYIYYYNKHISPYLLFCIKCLFKIKLSLSQELQTVEGRELLSLKRLRSLPGECSPGNIQQCVWEGGALIPRPFANTFSIIIKPIWLIKFWRQHPWKFDKSWLPGSPKATALFGNVTEKWGGGRRRTLPANLEQCFYNSNVQDDPLEGLLQHRCGGPTPNVSDSVGVMDRMFVSLHNSFAEIPTWWHLQMGPLGGN